MNNPMLSVSGSYRRNYGHSKENVIIFLYL